MGGLIIGCHGIQWGAHESDQGPWGEGKML